MRFGSKLPPERIAWLAVVPAFTCLLYLTAHAVNVPYMDDMELVYTINDLQNDPATWWRILFRQQNDHRVLFSRLAAVVVYVLTGSLDFRVLIVLGFGSLILLFYSLSLVTRFDLPDCGGGG